MVLAVVLVLLGIIVALVLQAQVLARSCLKLEKSKLTRIQLRETAGDGIWRALNQLAADPLLLVDHTNEAWAARAFYKLPGGIEVETAIFDENRFLDANMLAYVSPAGEWRPPAAIIRDLLAGDEQVANPETQTEIIRDWVDQDTEGNYEKSYYQRKEMEFHPDNLPMESRDELLWLLDTTTNTAFHGTALTILPGKERRIEPVNVNTADRQTLLAVFGLNNAALVERIIRARASTPITALDQVLDPIALKKYASYLSVRSSFFSVHARAIMGSSMEEVYCLAKRDAAGNVQVIRWAEY